MKVTKFLEMVRKCNPNYIFKVDDSNVMFKKKYHNDIWLKVGEVDLHTQTVDANLAYWCPRYWGKK